MRRSLVLVPMVVFLLGADDSSKEAEKLAGTWKVMSVEQAGVKAPEEFLKTMKMTIVNDLLILQVQGKLDGMFFKVDPTKGPKQIDLRLLVDGPSMPGIYELEGDNLKLCWNRDGDRPKGYVAPKENPAQMLLILQREKK